MVQIVIHPSSDVPPYEQLRTQIASQVARGELAPGSRLGTVRQTARDLGLAVNTVARAYRELESDGVVVTEGRRGTFVRSDALDGPRSGTLDQGAAARQAATDYVRAVRRAGLGKAEAVRLVDEAWH